VQTSYQNIVAYFLPLGKDFSKTSDFPIFSTQKSEYFSILALLLILIGFNLP